jgi:hypothetical protein
MRILGLVFNDVPGEHPTIAADNPRIVSQHTGLPILGSLPRSDQVVDLQRAFALDEPEVGERWHYVALNLAKRLMAFLPQPA